MADQKCAIIHDGVVSNTIVADPTTYEDPDGGLVVADATARKGWSWDGKAFTAPPDPPMSLADLLADDGARQNGVLAQVWTFDVGTAQAPLPVTTRLDAAGQAAMTQLLLWSMAAAPDDSEAYSNVDFSAATLSPAQAKSLATQAGAVKSQTYVVLNQLSAGIQATPPTITTGAEIDAAAWPAPAAAS